MTQPHRSGQALGQYPLSCAQELWCAGGDAGTFGPRFVLACALRITGQVSVPALQAALDDVVARHEILRTIVAPDTDPPGQRVYPPCPVPLRVRDLGPDTGKSRHLRAEELLAEAEQSSLDVSDLPLLRATLSRFDENDSVLSLVTHHTAGDGWSVQLIMRDLAALYSANLTGRQPALPSPPQYREYAIAQQAGLKGSAASGALEYWREQLDGAQIFALPNDRAVVALRGGCYTAHHFVAEADVMASVSALARATRSSMFMVLLAAFYVLAHQINGTTDPVVNTLTNGRNDRRFRDTVGPFLNFLPLRGDLSVCSSFRQVVERAKATCTDAYANEVPILLIEREFPQLMAPLADPRACDFIFGFFRRPFGSADLRIADGADEVRKLVLAEQVSSQLPGGAAWAMSLLPSGQLNGMVQFNVDEFDSDTVADWVSGYLRILSRMFGEPDRAWKTL